MPLQPRHYALDERGVGLRATWHADRGFVNVSLWTEDHCVQTFHLAPAEAGRLIGFLAQVLADAVPEPPRPRAVAAVPERRPDAPGVEGWSARLRVLRSELAAALDSAARRLRS